MTKTARHRDDTEDIRIALAGRAAELARHLLGEPNASLSSKADMRFGTRGSLAVIVAGKKAGSFFDHEVQQGGDLFDLIPRERSCDFPAALVFARDFVGRDIPRAEPRKANGKQRAAPGKIVATYDYADQDGELVFQVCRFQPKDFRQRKPNGKGWSWSVKGVKPVPYRLPEMLDTHDRVVVICEGERDADALWKLGVPATTNAGGAGKWHEDLTPFFRGMDVVIIPDNDPPKKYQKTGEPMLHPDGSPILPGQDHAQAVATALHGIAQRVRVLELWRHWPDMPLKGDVSDWIAHGGTAEALHGLIGKTADWVPPDEHGTTEPFEPEEEQSETDIEIARLAKLPPLDYERERKVAADILGCRASVLDRMVQHERDRLGGDDGRRLQGRAVELHEPKPSDDPVNGASLLNAIVTAIQTYIVLPEHAARSCAVWTLYTFLAEHFLVSPRLCISSPVMGCGKSTLTDIISRLVLRPLKASNATAAAILRVVEMHKPCLLIDEGDTFVELSEELRGILNSGHRHDGAVLRVVGEDLEPRLFATFSPCSVALIGELPPTLADRSIPVGLKRRRPADGEVRSFSLDEVGHLDQLARQSARWAQDHAVEIAAAKPPMPDGIINRARDNWRVLKAIATVVGGDWPGYIDAAALAAQARTGEENSQLEQLLSDIRDVAFSDGEMPSADLVQRLIELEGRPWGEMDGGKPLTQNRLARILKPVGIGPDNVGPKTARVRGYKRDQFEEAFERYLADPNRTPAHNIDVPDTSSIFEVHTMDEGCAVGKCEKSNNGGLAGRCAVAKGDHDVCDYCGRPGGNEVSFSDGPMARLHRQCEEPYRGRVDVRGE